MARLPQVGDLAGHFVYHNPYRCRMAKDGETPPESKGKDEQEHDAGLERLAGKMAKAETAKEWQALVTEFYENAVDTRVRNRELKTQLAAAQAAGPKKEDVVLTGDEAKHYRAIVQAAEKAGVELKDFTARFETGQKAIADVGQYSRDGLSDEAADYYGYNAKALRGVARLHNLPLERVMVQDPDGEKDAAGKVKKVAVVMVKASKEGEDPTPLDEYVEQHLGDFRQVLESSETERKSRTTESPAPRTSTAPRFLRQSSGEDRPGKGVSDEEYDASKRAEVSLRV